MKDYTFPSPDLPRLPTRPRPGARRRHQVAGAGGDQGPGYTSSPRQDRGQVCLSGRSRVQDVEGEVQWGTGGGQAEVSGGAGRSVEREPGGGQAAAGAVQGGHGAPGHHGDTGDT